MLDRSRAKEEEEEEGGEEKEEEKEGGGGRGEKRDEAESQTITQTQANTQTQARAAANRVSDIQIHDMIPLQTGPLGATNLRCVDSFSGSSEAARKLELKWLTPTV